jgi:hypothetical protein
MSLQLAGSIQSATDNQTKINTMIKKTLALLALAVVTTTAQAGTSAPSGKGVIAPTIEPESSISYSNISLSKQYASGSIFNGFADADLDGVALALEYSPVNNLYVALGGSYNEIEASLDIPLELVDASMSAGLGDYWTANAGVGGYIPLTSNIHFVTELGASYVDFLNQDNAWGIYVTPHIRASFGKFETHLGATYNSNDFATTEWNGFLRLIYAATTELDLFVTGSLGLSDSDIVQDVAGVSAGLRYKF